MTTFDPEQCALTAEAKGATVMRSAKVWTVRQEIALRLRVYWRTNRRHPDSYNASLGIGRPPKLRDKPFTGWSITGQQYVYGLPGSWGMGVKIHTVVKTFRVLRRDRAIPECPAVGTTVYRGRGYYGYAKDNSGLDYVAMSVHESGRSFFTIPREDVEELSGEKEGPQ